MTSPGPSAAIQGSNGNGGTAGTNSAVVGIGGDRPRWTFSWRVALLLIGLVAALGAASPGNAAAIVGANGGDGGNGSAGVRGTGGDGGGNAGSGGTTTSPTGAAGAAGTGGGGGQGGGGSGSKGGDSEFGLGGLGSSLSTLPPGGAEEAGGGGGQTGWGGGGGGGGGGGQRGLTISADTATIAAGDTVTGGNGGNGGNGAGNWYADGGNGGGGGIGLVYQGVVVLTVNGAITGGNGGTGGNGDPGYYSSGPVLDPDTKEYLYTLTIGSFGGSGGAGGTGLRSTGDGASIVINADISGGDGGDAGIGPNYPTRASGGPAGAGIVITGTGTTIQVNAAVSGGTGGLGSHDGELPTHYYYPPIPRPSTYGAGGAGIIGADLTVVLGADGSITGGLRGNGQDRADAVTFSGGANVFELQADTTSVVGKVVAGGTDDVFRLGGDTGDRSFDTALFGTQYEGFETYEKVGLGGWTLTGTGHAADWAVKVGTLSLDGITLDGAIDNEASVNASGRITGAISNRAGAWFTLTGDLEANSLITNDGYFAAYGSGTAGTFAVTGEAGFDNEGWISLSQSGGIAGDVLDLTEAGLFTGGADSGLALDIDLSGNGPVSSDQLLLGATTGSLQVSFNPDPSKYGALTDGVLVIQTADGNLQATAMGLQDRGLVDYTFQQIGTDWYVTSSLNAAPLGGMVAGMQATQGIVDLVSRPAALGLAANPSGSCGAGVYSSVYGGTLGAAAATSASDGGRASSDIATTYGGAQFDLDSGCLNVGEDADLRFGLVAGFNAGSATDELGLGGDTVLRTSYDFITGFAGIYAQLRSSGFIVDGQLGYDRTSYDLTAGVDGGSGLVIDGQEAIGQRLTAMGTIGYAFELDGVTLTPTLGFSASHASTSSVQLTDLGGRIDFADRDAVTGFAGLEVAMTQKLGDASIRYFASGTYAEDFGGSQAFTYSDDINESVELETVAGRSRGTVSAGFSYEGVDAATFGLRGDLSYADGQLGTGLTLKAGMSF